MAGSSFGQIFRVTTWGESHGKALGAVIDGCPAGLDLSEEDIQKRLKQARWEYTQAVHYDYIVVSEAPPECVVERINTILAAESFRTERNINLLNLEESL